MHPVGEILDLQNSTQRVGNNPERSAGLRERSAAEIGGGTKKVISTELRRHGSPRLRKPCLEDHRAV